MTRHVLHIPTLPAPGERLSLSGNEASHALRVKRVREGDLLVALDGAGGVAEVRVASVAKELGLEVVSVDRCEPLRPAVEVWSATPKGPRLGDLIDHLSQTGAASWTPMRTSRANIDPSGAKRTRLRRVAVEAMKQCRRPWLLELERPATMGEALDAGSDTAIVIADASGGRYIPSGAARIRLLIGPEGGWTDEELAAATSAGAQICAFGPHVMRIELAAAVASAVILEAERA